MVAADKFSTFYVTSFAFRNSSLLQLVEIEKYVLYLIIYLFINLFFYFTKLCDIKTQSVNRMFKCGHHA